MKRALPYLLYGVVMLVCFWKFLFLGWTLYDVRTLEGHLGLPPEPKTGWFESHRPPADRGDTVLSLPMLHRLYGEGLRQGELRLWNPYLFCGYPTYNNLLLHPFYPPNLLIHAALPPRTASDLNLLLHFFFSGAAMFWLLRASCRSDFAAWVGGLLWMLIGYNTFWFSTGTFMGASVFAPLALLGLRHGLATRTYRPLALGGLAMGMVILGSHGQHALHVLIFLSLWLLVTLIADRDARRFTLRGAGIFLGCALGAGMAAILTQLDSVLNGFRTAGGDVQLHYSSPWMLPTYMANVALGKVCYAPDGLLRSEFTIYAGVAGTALALAGAIRGWGDRWLRFLSIFAVAALFVAFLKPLAELALQIPFLNLSMPARWVYVFGFCLTLLAAAGIDALTEDRVRTSRILVLVMGFSVLSIAFYTKQGALVETLIGAALAAAWIVATWKVPRFAPGLLVAALAFDLIPNFVFFNSHADPKVLHHQFPAIEELRVRHKEPWRATGNLSIPGGTVATPNTWNVGIGSNILALYGIEALMGYESIAPRSTVLYCIRMRPDSVFGSGRLLVVDDPTAPLAGFANMTVALIPYNFTPTGWNSIGRWHHLEVFEHPDPLPRAYLAHQVVRDTTALGLGSSLMDKSFNPRTMVLLEDDTPAPKTAPGGGSVTWVNRETDRLELAVDAKADSILVISDTDYPGWECEVDDIETPILRANMTFRGVAVASGRHKVVLRFRPASARNGLIVSGLTIAAVLAWCARRKAL